MTPLRLPALAALALLLAGLGAGTSARAEDVDAAGLFATSKAAFDAHQYGKCAADLQLLLREVQRLRSEQVAAALPAAREGWTAQDAEGGGAAALGLFGGGLQVRREYTTPEGPSVSIELTAESPMIAGYAMWLANPAYLPQTTKVVAVKGRKGFLETDGNPKMTFLMNANTALLVVEGHDASKADVEAYANAVDFDKLDKALQN